MFLPTLNYRYNNTLKVTVDILRTQKLIPVQLGSYQEGHKVRRYSPADYSNYKKANCSPIRELST